MRCAIYARVSTLDQEPETVHRETDRAFATGERVQFTAPDREWHIANRELGTIEAMEPGTSYACVSIQAGRSR